jgi:Ran GTPase-activating protein (RanGAP) involved in mRNA processing and transport
MMKAKNLDQILHAVNEDWVVIDLSGKNLGLEGAKKLASWLKSHPNVRELNLANTAIDSEGAIVLAKALEKHTTLHKLDLGNNNISTRAIKEIAKVVEKQTNLQELCLNDNRIDDEAVTFLAKALEKNSSLHTLDLSNNLIKANGIQDLFNSLTNHSNFCVLNLKNNSIGSEGAKALAEKLVNHTKLEILDLAGNQIDGEGAAKLAGSIGKLPQLQTLDLEGNQIGNQKSPEGACVLANSFSKLAKLQKLNLCNNQIDDEAVKALTNALKDNIGLKSLNLACNQISSDGVNALVQLLETHCQSASILKFRLAPALETLNLSDNQIDSSGAKNLSIILERYTKLRELDLGNNNIGDEGAIAVAKLLAYYNSGWGTSSFSVWTSPSFKTLDLHDNQISDKGAHDLAKILQNFKLENLNLSNNAINTPIIQKISDSFKGNKANLILGNQSPQIEILPVTYSDGLTEDEIKEIKECVEEEINKTGGRRKTVRDSVNRMNDQEYIDNKNTILKLITDNTIFTEQNVDCIKDEIINYKESKNIRSINIIKNLIQHQNLISNLGNLNPEKSKLFVAQEDIAKIQSLIQNNKLSLEELSKINTDLFKLQSLIEESNLSRQKSNLVEKEKTEKAIFILGNIGAGKSTLANLLLGHELKGIKYDKELRIDTVDSTDVKISHAGNSETQSLNIRQADDIVVIDCPGFKDSDYVQKNANIYLINELCRAHDQIKFALVVTFSDVLHIRSPKLVKLVKQITNMVEDIDKIKESVSLVVTSVDDDTKKAIINNQIDNILQCNRDLSRNDKIIFEHLKDSVCLFLTPQEEDSLKATPLFTNIKYEETYYTDNITPLVNIEGKRDKFQQEFANKMINISNNNFNQIVHIIKEAIKHPLQCLDFKNSIFTKNHHLIEQSLREAPNYSNGREDYANLFNDKEFLFDEDFTKISLLNNLKQALAGKADSHEESVKNLTNVIRQFQHFATQEVQDNTVGKVSILKH